MSRRMAVTLSCGRGFLLALGQPDRPNPRGAIGEVEAEMPDLNRVDTGQNACRMAGDNRLSPLPARQILDLADDPRKVEGREIVFRLLDRIRVSA